MNSILWALAGGILIGISSSLLLWGIGRISGISGIYACTLNFPKSAHFWKYSFLLGLLVGGFVMYQLFATSFFNYTLDASVIKIIAAGLLVGFGTRLGNGCTSGHGVCGISRLAKRSIVATLVFMGAGILVVAIERFVS
jgi:uncharacterized membrane protein YedE/YeeE